MSNGIRGIGSDVKTIIAQEVAKLVLEISGAMISGAVLFFAWNSFAPVYLATIVPPFLIHIQYWLTVAAIMWFITICQYIHKLSSSILSR